MPLRRILPWTAIVALCLAALALLPADDRPEPATEPAPASALRASVDPETGELRVGTGAADDPAKADPELDAMLSKSTDGLAPVHHPDGRVSVRLDGRFMSASLARVGADGDVETLCTEDADEARAFLQAPPARDAHGREVR